MSRLAYRSSIAGAAAVVALLSSRPADAQVTTDPGPPRESLGLVKNMVTGRQYDIVNQRFAEDRVWHLEPKLAREAEHGHAAAADRIAHRLDKLHYRIAVDEWLIRKNALQDPGRYPYPAWIDCDSLAYIAQAGRPAPADGVLEQVRRLQSPTAYPTVPITIANTSTTGAGIAFTINETPHQSDAGSRQTLRVTPGSTISFDAGGSLGQLRYLISEGVYEFRSTPEGWALYKTSGTP